MAFGDGKVDHARGADLGPGRASAGRRERQDGIGRHCATPAPRANTPLAPQDGRPDGAFGHVVGGSDPGDTRVNAEGRPQVVDNFAHPSQPEVSR